MPESNDLVEFTKVFRSLCLSWFAILPKGVFDSVSNEFFMNREPWLSFYDHILHAAMKQEELVGLNLMHALNSEYETSVFDINLKTMERKAHLDRNFEIQERHFGACIKIRRDTAAARIKELDQSIVIEKIGSVELWKDLSRSIDNNSNIWLNVTKSSSHFKLDIFFEDSERMRRRFRVNEDFHTHEDASHKRDNSSLAVQASINDTKSPRFIHEKILKIMERLKSQLPGVSDSMLRFISTSSSQKGLIDEEDDMWTVVNADELIQSDTEERFLFESNVELIILMTTVPGRLELTSRFITFHPAEPTFQNETDKKLSSFLLAEFDIKRIRKISLHNLFEMNLRRYKLRRSALEMFFTDKTSLLFNFPIVKDRSRFISYILGTRPVNLIKSECLKQSPMDLYSKSDMTIRWVNREIDNFTYLMWLNTISGIIF